MKIFILSLLLVFNLSIANAQNTSNNITTPAPEEHLIDNKMYFFAHSMCTSCKDAYIYLHSKHPNINLPITDMKEHHHLNLYKECVKKFNIKNSELRLPLFCLGDNYIMG
jgi:hypothetical protein